MPNYLIKYSTAQKDISAEVKCEKFTLMSSFGSYSFSHQLHVIPGFRKRLGTYSEMFHGRPNSELN